MGKYFDMPPLPPDAAAFVANHADLNNLQLISLRDAQWQATLEGLAGRVNKALDKVEMEIAVSVLARLGIK